MSSLNPIFSIGYQSPRAIQLFVSRISNLRPKDIGLHATTFQLLIALAHRSAKDDCFSNITVSQETLGAAIGKTRRTVFKHLKELEEAGFISRSEQRKINQDQWSVRAIRFTQKFISLLLNKNTAKQQCTTESKTDTAMWEVFAHSPASQTDKNKEIKAAALDSSVVCNKEKQTTARTRHNLFIKTTDFDAETTKLTLDVLNKMSKKQCLYLLSKAKKNGVVLQDAIAYISGLNNKVKNWFSYLMHSLDTPQDYRFLMQAKSERSQKTNELSFVRSFFAPLVGKQVVIKNRRFIVEADQLYCKDSNSSVMFSMKNANWFANEIKKGLVVVVKDPLMLEKHPKPTATTTPPSSNGVKPMLQDLLAKLKVKRHC